MTHLEKMAIYDELSRLLTDYEQEGVDSSVADIYDFAAKYTIWGLYNLLVKIQNNWDELISEEE